MIRVKPDCVERFLKHYAKGAAMVENRNGVTVFSVKDEIEMFDIGITGEYWRKAPEYIFIHCHDGQIIFTGTTKQWNSNKKQWEVIPLKQRFHRLFSEVKEVQQQCFDYLQEAMIPGIKLEEV